MPTVISSGAVSPITRAIASITPVTMPAIDVRSTTLTTVSHLGTPRAYEASRSSFGTSRSISSTERMTTGVMRTASATAPMSPDRYAGPMMSVNSAKANRPATIDGMPVITSTRNVIPRATGPRPYSTR